MKKAVTAVGLLLKQDTMEGMANRCVVVGLKRSLVVFAGLILSKVCLGKYYKANVVSSNLSKVMTQPLQK
jgi:hypothetical protein